MTTIQKILVPVDFQSHTDELTEFAIDIANKLGAKIIFFHVVGSFAHIVTHSDVYPTSFMQADEELLGQAQARMTAMMDKREVSLFCEGQVLRGDAADCIVKYVADKNIDLIIMGTHGAQGIEKILLGSVAERVLKRASCPVLLFNPYKGERGYRISTPLNEAVQPV